MKLPFARSLITCPMDHSAHVFTELLGIESKDLMPSLVDNQIEFLLAPKRLAVLATESSVYEVRPSMDLCEDKYLYVQKV